MPADVLEAMESNDVQRVKALLAADPAAAQARDEHGVSAILLARYHGRAQILEALLGAAPELDIFEAAAVGDQKRVGELVASDPSLVQGWSSDGFTPLHLASFFDQPEVVEVLLETGADIAAVARNPMRVQPLHSAAAGGRARIAAALLERGADANARQEGGFVALHAAAQNGDAELLRLLLEHGADPTLATDAGKTARDLAHEAGHAELALLLSREAPSGAA